MYVSLILDVWRNILMQFKLQHPMVATDALHEGLMIQECEPHSRPMVSPPMMEMKWLVYFCIFICLFTGEDAWRLRATALGLSPWEESQE